MLRVLAKPMLGRTNPVNRLLYTEVAALGVEVVEFTIFRMLRGRYDVLHFHWPQNLVNRSSSLMAILLGTGFLLALRLLQARGIKVVWTVHNVYSHDPLQPAVEERFTRRLLESIDGLIFMSEESETELKQAFDLDVLPAKTATIPHGHYRDFYDMTASPEDCRPIFPTP